jgi:hypothetical protein
VLCSLYVANYIYGWIVPQDLDFYNPPASRSADS